MIAMHNELKQCSMCEEFSGDVCMVPEFVDFDSSWGYMLCTRCKHNRIAIRNEDLRVQFGEPD